MPKSVICQNVEKVCLVLVRSELQISTLYPRLIDSLVSGQKLI
jgi:hypothetical protein